MSTSLVLGVISPTRARSVRQIAELAGCSYDLAWSAVRRLEREGTVRRVLAPDGGATRDKWCWMLHDGPPKKLTRHTLTYLDQRMALRDPGRRCVDEPPDDFFPHDGEDQDKATKRIRKTAKRLCAWCPVRTACAEVGQAERWGLWGGVLYQGRTDGVDLLGPVRRTTSRSSNTPTATQGQPVGRELALNVVAVQALYGAL